MKIPNKLYNLALICIFCDVIFFQAFSSNAKTEVSVEAKALVKKINLSEEKKLEIILSKKADFKIFSLSNPQRLVVDIKNADIANDYKQQKIPSFIENFRYNKNGNDLRLVFESSEKLFSKNTSYDATNKKISSEIFIVKNDKKIVPEEAQKATIAISEKPDQNDFIIQKNGNVVRKYKLRNANNLSKNNSVLIASGNKKDAPKLVAPKKNPVIIIDAGHGGKDPGTIGVFARSREKNITLSYARELVKNLNQSGKYKVFLTRDSDNFITLQKRVEKARRKKADLFISLHANSIADNDVSGFSIYTLSENSSDKQAALLAQKENQADIINGIDFSGASRDIMKTLIDLSQRESKNSSANFAKFVIAEMNKAEVKILQNSHRFAGFMVLTAPDVSSVLIELGYLSNKHEEKILNSISYKRLITKSLTNAIDQYFMNFK